MQSNQANKQSYRIYILPKVIFIGVFAFILSACSGNSTPDALPTLVEMPTEAEGVADTQQNDIATSTSTRQPTDVVIVTDEPGQTQAVEAPTEPVAEANDADTDVADYQNEEGTLQVIVTATNILENNPDSPEAPAGQKYILLTTNLHNFTGDALFVDASSLTLIDTNGNRYAAIAPDDYLVLPIFDQTLDGATAVVGSVRFEIPADATGESLEWCPYDDCTVLTLRSSLP